MIKNNILDLFEDWVIQYNKGDGEQKELVKERMRGFVIALELSGKNVDANKCKEWYEQLPVSF